MDTVLDVIGSPVISNLLITVVGAVLTYVFGKVGTNILSDQKKKIAKEIVMMAVSQLADVAKRFKEENDTKKLTDEQIKTLTNNAIANAQLIGKDAGIDIVKTLGAEGAELAVKVAVKTLKSVTTKKIPQLSAAVEKILPLFLLGIFMIGCVTQAPRGWDTAQPNTITRLAALTEDRLIAATSEDRDFLLTIGRVAATAYDAAALSMETKSLRCLFAIQSANKFAMLLKPKREPTEVLLVFYGEGSESEVWMAFITHQVHSLRLKCNPPELDN